MSMLKTLATVAAGAMVARGVGKVMNNRGGGMGGQQGGLGGMLGGMLGGQQRGGGGLGGALGGMLGGGGQQGGGLGGALGGMLGGGQQQGGGGLGGALGGMLGGGQGGGGALGRGGLGGMLSGGQGGGGGLGGLLESLGGGATAGASQQAGAAQQMPPQPANGSLGDMLNSSFDNFAVEPSAEQENQAKVLLKAMISAAKSDGQIDAGEREKLLGHLGEDAAPEDIEFVKQELAAPLDMDGLVASVPQGMQQQVYLMSLMAIDLDTPAEAKYLDALARSMNLTPEVSNAIHDKLGAPRLYT